MLHKRPMPELEAEPAPTHLQLSLSIVNIMQEPVEPVKASKSLVTVILPSICNLDSKTRCKWRCWYQWSWQTPSHSLLVVSVRIIRMSSVSHILQNSKWRFCHTSGHMVVLKLWIEDDDFLDFSATNNEYAYQLQWKEFVQHWTG